MLILAVPLVFIAFAAAIYIFYTAKPFHEAISWTLMFGALILMGLARKHAFTF